MLNYAGPLIGSQPVSAMLPPATPGTIPSGVPGATPSPAPLPPQPTIRPPAGPHANALAAILKHAAGPAGSGPQPPAPPPQYIASTQPDGSILLHLKLPSGEVGPVVKVLPAIKHPLNPHQPPNISPSAGQA
jgi:hypothetical protein